MASLPNLFVIGSMKSGTTSLHNYLDAHPEIAMSENKEPGYFVEELTWNRGEQWYRGLFADSERYKYRGESSTFYTKQPQFMGVPERIARTCPDARLIYVMRDPFERIVSQYLHNVRGHHAEAERRSLLRAATADSYYVAFGHYARQLRAYFAAFGRDAVYTLTFESLLRNPQANLDGIFQWLGLQSHSIGAALEQAHNQRPSRIVQVAGSGALNKLAYSKVWSRLSPLVPDEVKRFARSLAYKQIDESKTSREAAELRVRLRDLLRAQVDELCGLLGREFPEWALENERSPERATLLARPSEPALET